MCAARGTLLLHTSLLAASLCLVQSDGNEIWVRKLCRAFHHAQLVVYNLVSCPSTHRMQNSYERNVPALRAERASIKDDLMFLLLKVSATCISSAANQKPIGSALMQAAVPDLHVDLG